MNNFLNGLKNNTNYTFTENGAVTHKTTRSDLLDMFAMGAAYRTRSENDVILMFRNAFSENPVYALKCLFYIRDVRGGQGERRFFRVAMKDLATWNTEAARRNIRNIPEFGRWDDLYVFVGTPLEGDAMALIKEQLNLDVNCETPSLLAKWLKSENTSSKESRKLAKITREYLGMTSAQYRHTLSTLRKRINVLERLMSAGEWDKIEFDKIPSKAGFIYKNAFKRHDLERANNGARTYADFAQDESTTVNAGVLYPYECVEAVTKHLGWRCESNMSATERAMVNKYWDNLADYFNGAVFNGIAVVDTSGSMHGTPINVAISLGLYCAEKAQGPFAGHYVSFSSRPQLIKTEGVDFVDKVERIYRTNIIEQTNIEATFNLLLDTALRNHCSQEDLPQNIIVISDMEFDGATTHSRYFDHETLMEGIAIKWLSVGYEMPHLIFWNVNARHNNIPMLGTGRISFVSGFSPSIFEAIMTGKTGYDLMIEKLDSERYRNVA